MANPFSEYKKRSVSTMTPMEVIVKLYNEIEKQLAIGINATENKDFTTANKAYVKAQDCISALRMGLDMNVDMSKNLDSLYDYFYQETVNANLTKDVTVAKSLIPIIGDLKEAFSTISIMPKDEITNQASVG